MKKGIFWFVTLLLLGLSGCTIVPIEEIERMEQSEEFDPAGFVDGIWDDQVVPTLIEKANDLPTVLTAIHSDLDSAGETYATVPSSGAFTFAVKGSGTITSVDTESRNGTAVLEVDGYSGPTQLILQIGPLFRGDSVRDGVGFLDFGDFKDQAEFGQVSRELNKRVLTDVVGERDLNALEGKKVTLNGGFTIRTTNQTNVDLSELTLTPVTFEVGE